MANENKTSVAKLLCVFSTLTASVEYTEHRTGENGIPVALGSVLIKGGTGVANQHVQTPRGVATMVTPAQAELLQKNELFKLHKRNGFVTLEEVARPPGEDAVEKAVAEMEGRDNSSPLVDADFRADQPTPRVAE